MKPDRHNDNETALKVLDAVSNDNFPAVLELLPQLEFEGDDDFSMYQSIENFVGSNSPEIVQLRYQAASDEEQADWKMAIQTHIACGERKDLEIAFAEWAGANPANHEWD